MHIIVNSIVLGSEHVCVLILRLPCGTPLSFSEALVKACKRNNYILYYAKFFTSLYKL